MCVILQDMKVEMEMILHFPFSLTSAVDIGELLVSGSGWSAVRE
jgi:hypothetical protein